MDSVGTAGAGVGADRAVLVVDDHRAVAQMLALAIDARDGLRCAGHVTSHAAALTAVDRDRPDVVVVDVHLGERERTGLDVARAVTTTWPGLPVVLLTGDASALDLDEVVASGACGLMAKGGDLDALLSVVASARTGRLEIDPVLLRHLASRPAGPPGPALTARESQVLALLAEGLDVARISHRLGLRPHTCRGYVKAILHKLDAHSQLEAVATARRRGLV